MTQTLTRNGVALAYEHRAGRVPTVMFLPGYGSDMTGDKATALAAYCVATDRAFLRMDYAGHGASGGDFADGTVGSWTEDALAVLDHVTARPVLLVGSSMGGWIGLLMALARPEQIAGFVGIAAAPDFTERLMWAAMMPAEREALMRDGSVPGLGTYMLPRPITRTLIEDGRRRLLLDAPIPLRCPVRLLHGMADDSVPWEFSTRIARAVTGGDVQVTLVKDGDHRLSRPADLAVLRRTVAELVGEDGA